MSWSAYYASLQPTHGVSESSLTNTSLLALFLDSVAMIRNPMNIVKKAVDSLNPGQAPIITVDQPCSQLQNKSSGPGQQVTRNTHVTRTRRAHQITASRLDHLL